MPIWLDLISRELVLLAILTTLGLGPTSFLGEEFDPIAKLAFAPAFGLCIGAGIFTSLLWFTPAARTSWLIPVLCVASSAVAWLRRGEWRKRPISFPADREAGARRSRAGNSSLVVDIVQLVVVCIAAAVPITYTVHQRDTVGPVTYYVADVGGYVAGTDGSLHESLQATEREKTPHSDLAQGYWINYVQGNQQLGVIPFFADVDGLLGLWSTQTDSSFLVVLIIVGALGAYAAVRCTVGRRTWAAVLAGSLFGGAFFLQLFFDGSESAIGGLALVLPLVTIGWEALRKSRVTYAVLFALLLSGIVELYPVLLAPIGITVLAALVAHVVARARSGEPTEFRFFAGLTGGVLAVLVLVPLFDVVAFERATRYWSGLVRGVYQWSTLPPVPLGAGLVPGWLLQTRELYNLTFSGHSATSNVILAVAVPTVLIAVALLAVWRFDVARLLVPFVVTCVVIAVYERIHGKCSYCEGRSLLPIGPILLFLIALGIASLAMSRRRWEHWVALAAVALTLLSTGYALRSERLRFVEQSYFLDGSARTLVSKIPHGAGETALEGFDEGAHAPIEQFLIYELLDEQIWGKVSLPDDVNDNNALGYMHTPSIPGPQFDPRYTYVLTRMAGVSTQRQVVARDGAIALERRSGSLDVLVDSGLSVAAAARDDPDGRAYVNPLGAGNVEFVVTGGSGEGPAYVGLRLVLPSPQPLAVTSATAVHVHQTGKVVEVCVQTIGRAPVRVATVKIPSVSGAQLVATAANATGCPASPNR